MNFNQHLLGIRARLTGEVTKVAERLKEWEQDCAETREQLKQARADLEDFDAKCKRHGIDLEQMQDAP